MMWDWQTISALLLVAAAGLFVLRRVRNLFAGESAGCGSGTGACGSCPSQSPAAPGPALYELGDVRFDDVPTAGKTIDAKGE